MITPYNSRFSSNSFSTGSQTNPYQLPSSINTASAFDVGSISQSAPLFQSSAFGLPNAYPSSASSALDAIPITNADSGIQQVVSMITELVKELIQVIQSGSDTAGSPGATSKPLPHQPQGKSGAPVKEKTTTDPPPSAGSNGASAADQSNGAGWNKNVAVMASSDAHKETVDYYSGGKLVGGYLSELEKGMDSNDNIADANKSAQANSKDGAVSSGVTANSLVKGKGGNALIVTGDNYDGPDTDDSAQLAEKLKKDYGMNVTVIKNASPNQVKAALQKMGQDKVW